MFIYKCEIRNKHTGLPIITYKCGLLLLLLLSNKLIPNTTNTGKTIKFY